MRKLVQYLNTLHRLNGSNVNTTAEANINNEYSKRIIVKEETLVNQIIDKLDQGNKVLLTGFAGDGKTTLASLVAEKLVGHPIDFSLPIIRFEVFGNSYVIIKDLSEIPMKEAEDLLFDELSSSSKLLIVSNTGSIHTKLIGIYNHKPEWRAYFSSESALETEFLKGIECEDNSFQGEIRIGSIVISTFNLVKRDNLETAEKVLRNILNLEEWDNATPAEKESIVYFNVQMMKANDYLAVKRIFILYRRIYEYGHRLTMRNLIEHFAYTITGNRQVPGYSSTQYFFSDNFFGAKDSAALVMDGVRLVNSYDFGSNVSSAWKRRIWIGHNPNLYHLDLMSDLKRISRFTPLFNEFCYLNSCFDVTGQLSVLRMIFFLNNVSTSDDYFKLYIQSFLESPGFLYFDELQQEKGKISRKTGDALGSIIKDVLRDYCSGLTFQPDSLVGKDCIYITMDRKSAIIKQSTQIVTGDFEWKRSSVEIASSADSRGIYQFYLRFKVGRAIADEVLIDLPLLDYFMKIYKGASLEGIDSTFQKRLDNIKLKIQRISNQDDDGIRLIYKDINNCIHALSYFEEDGMINIGD